MYPSDYIIIIIYFGILLLIGVHQAKRQRGAMDFFLAGRSMSWFPIGLSVMITAFSAINYTAFSGEVFSHGCYVLLSLPVFIAVSIPITRIIMPFYHRLGLRTAYEYLEKRFDLRVRGLGSLLFMIWRLFWMATLLYVPSVVLSRITGLDPYMLILICGVIATVYTTAGGMRAVMWSDVLQFFVLFGGLLFSIVVVVLQTPGGFQNMLHLGTSNGLMKPFYPLDPGILSFDPRIRISLWSAWIGTFTAFMARYGVDQVVVQRYFTAKSLRDAQRGFYLNIVAVITSLLLLALMGLAIHAHAFNSGLLGEPGLRPVAYFTLFVGSLPQGVTGLIVAGLFAASMSSVDSGVNSCVAAFMTDFYARIWKKGKHDNVRLSRWLTLAFGLLATIAAMSVRHLGSIFEIANKVINGFGSPLLAIFILGMFSRRANSRGVFYGGLLGALWSAGVSFGVKGLALHYYAVVNLLGTLVICYGLSLVENWLTTKPTENQISMTWQGLMGRG